MRYNAFFVKDTTPNRSTLVQEQESAIIDANTEITEISVDSVKGILPEEAEKLCFFVLGEKDAETGFPFSFSVAGAVETDKKQYYVIRASWLVNNSHMSYIGDFFVSADGKKIYDGIARPGEYTMGKRIWNK